MIKQKPETRETKILETGKMWMIKTDCAVMRLEEAENLQIRLQFTKKTS